jgi:hypothetical protein
MNEIQDYSRPPEDFQRGDYSRFPFDRDVVAPMDKLASRDKQIFTERDQKLEAAREARKQKRLEKKTRPTLHLRPTPGKLLTR